MIGVRHSAFLDCVFDKGVGFAIVRNEWEKIIEEVLNGR